MKKATVSCLVNFRHLKAFIAVAELCSITRASESLYRSQSTVTRSILALESALGVNLFERKASGMLCNTFGQALRFRVTRAFNEFESGVNEIIAAAADGRVGLRPHFPCQLFHETRLTAFVQLAKTGHMPSVAKELGLTQPAISRAINDLEKSLDVRLFQRTPQGMLLTDPGHTLCFRVKRALHELRLVETDVAALQGTTKGRIVIGALPLGRTSILPRAITSVLSQHPQLQVVTVEGPYDALARKLRSGDIDFIFGALRPADQVRDLVGEALFSDCMAVVVRASHPLAKKQQPTLQDLSDCRWVLPDAATPSRKQLALAFKLAALPAPSAIVETSDLAILRGVLSTTDYVTAISALQLEHEISSGMFTVLDIALPNTTRLIGITHRNDTAPSPAATLLMSAIRRLNYAMTPALFHQ